MNLKAAAILLLGTALSCAQGSLGSCKVDGDCPTGAVCDPSAKVCTVPDGVCFPACTNGQTCVNGACTTPSQCTPACTNGQTCVNGTCTGPIACSPACDSSHTCDTNTGTCVINTCSPACTTGFTCNPVTQHCDETDCVPACDSAHVCNTSNFTCVLPTTADITVTSPAANAFATGTTLSVAATAHAPGGVTGVTFELRSTANVVLATATGTLASGANYTGSISLTGIPDGAAKIDATVGWSGTPVTSAFVPITVDQHAPAITLTFDGSTLLFGGGETAQVTASIADTGSGVNASSVKLTANGHDFAGTSNGGNVYTFAVLLDDNIAPAGTTTSVPFTITAADNAGNSTTLSGNPGEVFNVDRDAPAITAITVVTPPDSGSVYKGTGGNITVTANITDGAGIDTTCLVLQGETGCPHTGSKSITGNKYTFLFPRPTTGFDGTNLTFVINATDKLGAQVPAAFKAEHTATTATQSLEFDNTAPVITITPDNAHYARSLPGGGADVITVNVTITDGTSVVSPKLNGSISPDSQNGSSYTFSLDLSGAPSGKQQNYTFSISAQDLVGNSSSVNGSVFVDDVAPAASVEVFTGSDPAVAGVTYPALAANTGYIGSNFIYSDTVHVKGTLSDPTGIGSADYHIDGLELDGGVSSGVTHSLPCTAGSTTCNFDVQVALNDSQNGAFHTGTATQTFTPANGSPAGAILLPWGQLQVVVDATDSSVVAGGGAGGNDGSSSLAANTTRLLWYATLDTTANAAVSGIAVHPSGDVIVTLDGGVNTVFDVAPDSATVRWSYDAGVVNGTPAVGSGDATHAPIYVAARTGDLFALSPTGAVVGHATTASPLHAGPTVIAATIAGKAADQVIVADNNGTQKTWTEAFDGGFFDGSSVGSNGGTRNDGPMALDGGVWVPTSSGVDWHSTPGDGTLGAKATLAGTSGKDFYQPITDGQNAYLVQHNTTTASGVWVFSAGVVAGGSANFPSGVHPVAPPTVGIDGNIYESDDTPQLGFFPATIDSLTQFASVSAATKTPLHGSDGHIYLPRGSGFLYAFDFATGQISWNFDPQGNIFRGGVIDCQGRLFIGSGPTLFAFVTDDKGMADTGWPSLRRDSRGTANAAMPKYGIRTASGCSQ